MEIRSTGLGLGFAMLNGQSSSVNHPFISLRANKNSAIIIMLVQVTPIAVEAISWRYFLIFVFMDAIFVVVFYFVSQTARTPGICSLTHCSTFPRRPTSHWKRLQPYLETRYVGIRSSVARVC